MASLTSGPSNPTSKWGMPYRLCIHSTVSALRWLFTENPDTKSIKWPKEAADQQRAMLTFKGR
jgi:hypothetical protein